MTKERKIKGRVAEAAVLKHFVGLGFDVFTGYTDNNMHDLLVVMDSEVKRVFTRFTSYSENDVSWVVRLTSTYRSKDGVVTKKFDPDSFDLIAIYIGPEDRVVVIDADINSSSAVSIPKHEQFEEVSSKDDLVLCSCGTNYKRRDSIRCRSCSARKGISRPKIEWPPLEDVISGVETLGLVEFGKSIGAHQTTVKEHLARRGADIDAIMVKYRESKSRGS